MTANHDLERRVADFYAAEAPQQAPDRVLEQALATIDTTRQRRELWLVPRRIQSMNVYTRLAVAAVVVLAVGALGLTLLGPGRGPSAGGPNPSSSALSSAAPSTSPSQPPSPPPLTESYTSTVHGLSISYPSGWATEPATDPESTAEPGFLSPAGDFLFDPELRDHLFIALGSDPLHGEAGETWATAVLDAEGCSSPQSTTVDGAPALICGQLALAWVGDRGYRIRLYTSGDDPQVGETYDQAFFEDVLATVRLPPAT